MCKHLSEINHAGNQNELLRGDGGQGMGRQNESAGTGCHIVFQNLERDFFQKVNAKFQKVNAKFSKVGLASQRVALAGSKNAVWRRGAVCI